MRNIVLPLLTLAALLVLVALPALFVLLQAVFPQLASGSLAGAFGAVPALARDPQVPVLLGGTLKTGLGVAFACALIGIPLGALRGLFAVPLARCWDVLILVPFLTPPYIAGLSWMLALQQHGYLEQLTGLRLDRVLFSRTGMVLVMSLNIFPVVYFAVSRAMETGGHRLAEVARVHGAGPWRAFRLITLPLALPAVFAGLLLAFTLAIEEYGVPAALGMRAGAPVLTVAIEQRLADWPIDLTSASLLSLLLVALALTAYGIQRALSGGLDVATTGGKPAAIASRPLGVWRWPVLLLFGLVTGLAVTAPVAAMLATAFSGTVSGGLTAANLTLRHFVNLFARHSEATDALGTSLGLAFGTALLTGAVGFMVAWLTLNARMRAKAFIDALSLLPAALPGVVVGVGLILAWNRRFWPVTPYDSWVILLLAYSCLLLPYPVRYAGAALRQLGANLEPAARVHGATAGRALRYIVLPLVFPALLASMLMVFAIASRELVTSLLLSPPGVQTVSVFIWRQFEQGSVGDGMAMASIAMFSSILVMLAALGLLQRRRR
ncbi:ABC transporter permease [Acerihabitans arboris]|uniref:ABC transporter permease subunit n=1 Tax=Acerihabitans arboris TaxID=2691583 RepID=A0A845SJ93_9GAMM|nr:iron ABC transporter permease [Acerihabitans arboris]NDL64009.1 ABC transporter permease subunit [Acerihabitans arboris]